MSLGETAHEFGYLADSLDDTALPGRYWTSGSAIEVGCQWFLSAKNARSEFYDIPFL